MSYGLYIHIPFCAKKCPYCGFYSEVKTDDALVEAYLEAMLAEIASINPLRCDTIYVGGGTPSSLGLKLPAFLHAMLERVEYSGREFTVEVNPESVNMELCSALRDLPLSRVSIGVQSLSDKVLAKLGRAHDAKQAVKAYELLRKSLTVDINMDLIYDIPGVTWAAVERSAGEIVKLSPEHISAYSYSPDTLYLADSASESPKQTGLILELLEKSGYARYEISNFALSGKESAHNMKYWSMEEYLGIGAAAHSMVYTSGGLRRRYCHKGDIKHYMADPLRKDNVEVYSADDAMKESVVFGLRQVAGVDMKYISEFHQKSVESTFLKKIAELADENLLEYSGNNLRATPKGLLLLNSVMEYLW